MTILLSFLLAAAPQSAAGASPAGPPAPPAAIAGVAAQARTARESGRLDEAAALYRKAVAGAPQWAEGWWSLGAIHYERNQFPPCRDAFRRFIALEPKHGPGAALLGLCEFQTKEFPESLSHLEKAYQLGMPNDPQLNDVTLYHIALLSTLTGDYERTIALCRTLMRTDFNKDRVIAAAGAASMRRSVLPQEIPEADRELAYLLGKAVASVDTRPGGGWQKDFEEVIAAYPKAPNAHYWYATLLLANDPDRGVDALNKELAISPEHVPALIQMVFEYIRRGEAEKAKPYAERAVKAAPNNFVTHASLGRVLVLTDQIDEAIKELTASVKMNPESPQAHLWLAQAYSKAGRQQDALRERAEFARLKKAAEEKATPNLLR